MTLFIGTGRDWCTDSAILTAGVLTLKASLNRHYLRKPMGPIIGAMSVILRLEYFLVFLDILSPREKLAWRFSYGDPQSISQSIAHHRWEFYELPWSQLLRRILENFESSF
jgi:hypothetical protein